MSKRQKLDDSTAAVAPAADSSSESDSDSSEEEEEEVPAAKPEEIWGYSNKLPQRTAPPDIKHSCDVLNLKLHPQADRLVISTVDGKMAMWVFVQCDVTLLFHLVRMIIRLYNSYLVI